MFTIKDFFCRRINLFKKIWEKARNFIIKTSDRKLIFLLALGICLRFFFFVRLLQKPLLAISFGDPGGYYDLAKSFIQGTGFPTSIRPPGYPLLIAEFLKIFGYQFGILGLIILNYSLGLLTAYFIYRLLKVNFNKITPYLGFGLYALNPAFALYESSLFTEPLFIFLAIFSFYLLFQHKRYITSTIILAVASYVRPSGIVIFLIVFIYLFFHLIRKQLTIVKYFVLGIVFLFLIFPWCMRNKMKYNRYFFSNIDEFNVGLYTAPIIYSMKYNIPIKQARIEWLTLIYNKGNFYKKYPLPDLEKAKELSAYWAYQNSPDITNSALHEALKLFLISPQEVTVYTIRSMTLAFFNNAIYPFALYFYDYTDSHLRKNIMDNVLQFKFIIAIRGILFLYKNFPKAAFFSTIYLLFNILLLLFFLRKLLLTRLVFCPFETVCLVLFIINWFIAGFVGLGGARYFSVSYPFGLLFIFTKQETSHIKS
uniref:Glycosyltransferase RgtA/B/C/D-like domain-containing protein n=1 Tax=candidate division WOR-3 bacterium TaxID=2052148 RepID=A0A7C4XFM0_UNCW3